MTSCDKNIWRIIAFFSLLCFILVVVYIHFFGNGESLALPSILTIISLIFSIIFPMQFYIFGILACFWGLFIIFYSGSLFGFLVFLVGISFFYKAGFFSKHGALKLLCFGLVLFSVIVSLYRFGLYILLNSCLEFLGLLFFFGIFIVLYEDKIHFFQSLKDKDSDFPLLAFSSQEIVIATFLCEGQKYGQIAEELAISESTVKRTVQKMYDKLEVKSRNDFIQKYQEFGKDKALLFD